MSKTYDDTEEILGYIRADEALAIRYKNDKDRAAVFMHKADILRELLALREATKDMNLDVATPELPELTADEVDYGITKEETIRAMAHYNPTASNRAIAKFMGIGVESVGNILRR